MATTKATVRAEVFESLNSENQSGSIRHLIEHLIDTSSYDEVFSDRRTLSASASEVLDLAGSLEKVFGGDNLACAKLHLVLVVNRNSTAGDDLELGPDSTAGVSGLFSDTSDRITIPAGGAFLWHDPNGITVTGGSADELYVAETGGANSVSYDILILGASS
ncbi:MAG: hypothetical protein H6739_29405 [Alphaproteobacteria bacterium]|nr:hypothetical protein [Alphaproteobacteria bacterium]